MGDESNGQILYKGFLNLRYGVALTFQEYYCVLSDTGVFLIYPSEDHAMNNPSKFLNQVRIGGTKDWNGNTMFSTMDNSFKFVTDKGKEISATGHNRNEVTLWAKWIKAITDPDSKEGQKLAKARRKQQREHERELKKQEEYEIRARVHRSLPSTKSTDDSTTPPISYLTDPRRTRLDARNFPKYRQHLQEANLETRLTAPLDEAKPEAKKKKKKKRSIVGDSSEPLPTGQDYDERSQPPSMAVPATSVQSDPINDLDMKFRNLLQLGFSHEEVKNFMVSEGHDRTELDAVSRKIQRTPGSPLKKSRMSASVPAAVPPPPPILPPEEKKVSFFDKIRSGFRRDKA